MSYSDDRAKVALARPKQKGRVETVPQIGSVVGGRYEVRSLLGEGGMGAVYEAVNTFTQRVVALKTLASDRRPTPEAVARFLREGRAVSRLEHPNVVQVLDMGADDDGSLFIVQERLRGIDLRHWLDGAPTLEARGAVALLLPVLDALCYAHDAGVVHRDVKPENIFLAQGPGGRVMPKLIDFGIARVTNAPELESITRSGSTFGTASYMAPEQARGERDVGPASDVWSCGAVLFELLTRRRPFEGSSYNVVIAQVLTSVAPRVDAIDETIHAGLADVIARALEPDRAKRYRSMPEFRAALLAWSGDEEAALDGVLQGLALDPHAPARGAGRSAARDATKELERGETEPVRVTEEIPPPERTLPSRESTREPRTHAARVVPWRASLAAAFALMAALSLGLRRTAMHASANAAAQRPRPTFSASFSGRTGASSSVLVVPSAPREAPVPMSLTVESAVAMRPSSVPVEPSARTQTVPGPESAARARRAGRRAMNPASAASHRAERTVREDPREPSTHAAASNGAPLLPAE